MSGTVGGKIELRRRIVQERSALSDEERRIRGERARERFTRAWPDPEALRGARIAMYKATGGEFSLKPLKIWFLDRGAELYFPRVTDRASAAMEMARVRDPEDSGAWVDGHFRIPEPISAEVAPPETLDLIIVPGVAFDSAGHRMGWGGGYYDRFLPRASRALRVALVYDFQLEPDGSALTPDEWDQPVDWIVTDRREVRTARIEAWLNARSLPALVPHE